MKRFLLKFGELFATFAIVITTINANTTCVCIMHQEHLPKEAEKLRRF